jgi:hypothetical protein
MKGRTVVSFALVSALLCVPISSALALDSKHATQNSVAQVDAQLAKKLEQISKTQESNDFEKLQAENKELLKYLKTVSVQPQIMNDPLKKAVDKGLTVLTSDDKKVRCYSWDTLTGGTMHFFNSLFVYDAGSKQLKCEAQNPSPSDDQEDPGSIFEDISTIKTKDGKTVYLVQDLFIGSGMDHGRTITAYTINDGELKKHTFFQAGKKQLDSISFGFGEYADGTEFELSSDKKVLKVPLIKPAAPDAPGSGTATGKFLNYYFDGSKYVFKKN